VAFGAALRTARTAQHTADIRTAISFALEVAKGDRCNSPEDLKRAWNGLHEIRKGDPLFIQANTAVAGIERCRKAAYKLLFDALRETMKRQRKQWADEYERKLLDEGLDVHVRLGGDLGDRVTIQYVLFNRAWAHKITGGGSVADGSFLGTLQKIGFKRVTCSDGFSESFSYDLAPETEEQALGDGDLAHPYRL